MCAAQVVQECFAILSELDDCVLPGDALRPKDEKQVSIVVAEMKLSMLRFNGHAVSRSERREYAHHYQA